ncbi:MAG: ABC transporter ATP-binding protein, partial [Hyphomicrobiaceae bacterium]|nr:ABC transporter ATP-binding protein [Hyphomicrobiaceae bacterium]
PAGRVSGGEILYKGEDLAKLDERGLNRLRWKEIALIPQSAMNGFDPVYRITEQIEEAIDAHDTWPAERKKARIEEMFALVGLERSRLNDYPHQFSGGMRQRAMIAMALVLDPTLVVADEPTTGLDVIVQDQILYRIKQIHDRLRKTMLLITHDMPVVSENCDKIVVMYAGKIMEYGGKAVFRTPYHPYTLGLCNAFPDLGGEARDLISIPKSPPDLLSPPPGCRFASRCPFATDECRKAEPPMREVQPGHVAACHHLDQVERFRREAAEPDTWRRVA